MYFVSVLDKEIRKAMKSSSDECLFVVRQGSGKVSFGLRHEKTCLRGFRPGPTQTGHTITEDG